MIDNIKITLTKDLFNGNFDNATKVFNSDKNDIFIYANGFDDWRNHILVVRRNHINGNVIIQGSLRKWFWGMPTFNDFTKSSFEKALIKLANTLNINYTNLLKGKITQCEIGLNVRTHVPCNEIVPNIIVYNRMRKPLYVNKETVYFIGADKKFCAYDKGKEIKSKLRSETKSAFLNVLEEKGYHFLRVEIRMKDHQSFVNSKISAISTLADLLDKWSELYCFWAREVSGLVLLSKISVSPNMSAQEYLLANYINNNIERFEDAKEEYLAHSPYTLNKAKYNKARRELECLITEYGDKRYNTKRFQEDCFKTLIDRGPSENLDLLLLQTTLGVDSSKKYIL